MQRYGISDGRMIGTRNLHTIFCFVFLSFFVCLILLSISSNGFLSSNHFFYFHTIILCSAITLNFDQCVSQKNDNNHKDKCSKFLNSIFNGKFNSHICSVCRVKDTGVLFADFFTDCTSLLNSDIQQNYKFD